MAQSQVTSLREALEEFARMSSQAAESMEEMKAQYQKMSEQVLGLIAGTSTGADREVIDSIEQASSAVGQAQDELGKASTTASRYGSSL